MCAFKGLPKLRLLVTASGAAPAHAKFRAASATAPIAPDRGFSHAWRPLQSTTAATPRFVPGMRTTPASPPGRSTVLARTVVSYCSYIHCLDATLGDSTTDKNASSSAPGASCKSGAAYRERSMVRRAFASGDSSPGRSYVGQPSVRGRAGISATTVPASKTRKVPESVTRPTTAASSSHFSRIVRTAASLPDLATTSMRSCDSESSIS